MLVSPRLPHRQQKLALGGRALCSRIWTVIAPAIWVPVALLAVRVCENGRSRSLFFLVIRQMTWSSFPLIPQKTAPQNSPGDRGKRLAASSLTAGTASVPCAPVGVITTWWFTPGIVCGVQPSYNWIKPTYRSYNWGYNPLMISGMSH